MSRHGMLVVPHPYFPIALPSRSIAATDMSGSGTSADPVGKRCLGTDFVYVVTHYLRLFDSLLDTCG